MKNLFLTFLVLTIMNPLIAHAGDIKGKVTLSGKGELEDIVVYVEDVKGNFPLPKKRPEMNHIHIMFKPNILAVMKGSTVDFPNSDPLFHSAFSISKSNPFDLGLYGPGHEKAVPFPNPGLVEVFCHIHSDMHAYILVLDNPFFAPVSKDGAFTIHGVPAGTYSVKAWMSPSVNAAKTAAVSNKEAALLNFTLQSAK
ncbi:MAG: hypothetical protein HY266_00815 [Deltaproteobacteria bacterium]|nr:hypothetical protein [Deltaproteobacteria bacterium]